MLHLNFFYNTIWDFKRKQSQCGGQQTAKFYLKRKKNEINNKRKVNGG